MTVAVGSPLLIQDALRGGKSYQAILDQYGLVMNRHGEFKNLCQFKYHMLNSPMADPLVRQCRGLILDQANDWAVVARPFDKFFNHQEGHAAPIDWATAKVQEKLDGSLMTLYFYDGKWRVASSGLPDASGEVNGMDFNFGELFWDVWKDLRYKLPHANDEDMTFMFELMTTFNKIVVRHPKSRIVLTGVRDRLTGLEVPVNRYYNWEIVKTYPLTTFYDVIKSFDAIDPTNQEGYVVVDHEFNRIKVKHPGYVALHHMRGEGLNPRRVLEIVRAGEIEEVCVHFPEWSSELEKCAIRYHSLVRFINLVWGQTKGIKEQKEFALTVKDLPFSGVLFAMRKSLKDLTVVECLKEMRIEKLAEIVGL